MSEVDIQSAVDIQIQNNKLVIKTPYNKEFVKMIKNRIHWSKRSWDPNQKAWIVEITESKEEAYSAIRTVKLCFKDYDTSTILSEVENKKTYFGWIDIVNDNILFYSTYNQEFINEIKKIPSSRFNSAKKAWVVPKGHYDPVTLLKIFDRWNFKENEHYKKLIKELKDEVEKRNHKIDLSKKVDSEEALDVPLPEGLELYPFQKIGVEFIEKTNARTLLADEMGTGKTVQSLAYLYANNNIRPVLIITPASVKLKWEQEIKKWCPDEDIAIINGRKGEIDKANFYLINYDIIHARAEQLSKIKFACVILDESHYIKNAKAKRTQSILKLCQNIPKKICLTGTPILNRPAELYTTLKLLGVDELSDYWHYHKRYCNAKKNKYGWDMSGASNLDELQEKLRSSVMIRRLKKDVLTELPKKQRILIPIEVDNRDEYNRALRNFKAWYSEHKDNNIPKNQILAQLEALKQIAVRGKMKAIEQFVTDAAQSSKIVLFAHHRDVQKHLGAVLNCRVLEGGLDANKKQAIIKEFNDAALKPLVISIKAGGVGIDLQSASTAVFSEITWTPADLRQAEDRLHRIGQEMPVSIYYLIAKDTIEETMYQKIVQKLEISSAALDNETADDLAFDIIDDLLNIKNNNNKNNELNNNDHVTVLPSNQQDTNNSSEKTVVQLVQLYDHNSLNKLDILQKLQSIDLDRYQLELLYKNQKRIKYDPRALIRALLYVKANNLSLLAFHKQLKYDAVLRNALGFDKKCPSYQQLWHFLNKRLGKERFNKIYNEVIKTW